MASVTEKGGLKILSVLRAISRFYVSSANKAKRKPDHPVGNFKQESRSSRALIDIFLFLAAR